MLQLFAGNEVSNILKFNLSVELGKLKDFKFTGEIQICPNPFCSCRDVKFTVKNEKTSNTFITDDSPYEFYIDIFSHKYVKHDTIPEAKNKKFAQSFIKKLTKDNWLHLLDAFFDYKYYLIDHFDIENTEISINFPVYDIENEGAMFSYRDIFHFGKDLLIEHNKTKYLIDDQYCLDPKCPCTHVALSFVPHKYNKFVKQEQMALRLNYNKLTWEIINEKYDDEKVLKPLIEKTMEVIPDFINTVKKRHETMRLIYRQFKLQNFLSRNTPKKIKTGRNEPCPCGSGKKYKKCCGK